MLIITFVASRPSRIMMDAFWVNTAVIHLQRSASASRISYVLERYLEYINRVGNRATTGSK